MLWRPFPLCKIPLCAFEYTTTMVIDDTLLVAFTDYKERKVTR